MIIAVDFDGTLCKNAWPDIGQANEAAIRELKHRQMRGDKIVLWTCRCGDRLNEAIEWCEAQGLRFDAINDNLPELIAGFGNNTRKIYADEYWDDKAVKVIC